MRTTCIYVLALVQAAFQGSPHAMLSLGLAHLKGVGLACDAVEGAKWVRKASNRGLAQAQYALFPTNLLPERVCDCNKHTSNMLLHLRGLSGTTMVCCSSRGRRRPPPRRA